MNKQMCWLKDRRDSRRIILHLRENNYQPWRPYYTFSYSVPDYRIPNGSKGWATYQHLRNSGWVLLSTMEAKSSAINMNSEVKRAA